MRDALHLYCGFLVRDSSFSQVFEQGIRPGFYLIFRPGFYLIFRTFLFVHSFLCQCSVLQSKYRRIISVEELTDVAQKAEYFRNTFRKKYHSQAVLMDKTTTSTL